MKKQVNNQIPEQVVQEARQIFDDVGCEGLTIMDLSSIAYLMNLGALEQWCLSPNANFINLVIATEGKGHGKKE